EAQGKLKDAIDRYDRVSAAGAAKGSPSSAATLALVASMRLRAQTGQPDAALTGLKGFLDGQDAAQRAAKADWSPNYEALAAAWNAFGDAYAAKGDHQSALLSYLRVVTDSELAGVSGERARALYAAAQSFEKAKTQDWKERAEQLKHELKEMYPTSPWAQK